MAMSPRLLRPIASGVHPEANDWRSRVVANGGSVSASSMKAVSTFCAAIDAAGIRDRFFRLSLVCGNSLLAALVPLYRGPSRTGTQLANLTDVNTAFVSGDYVESLGLQGSSNAGKSLRLADRPFSNIFPAGNNRQEGHFCAAFAGADGGVKDVMGINVAGSDRYIIQVATGLNRGQPWGSRAVNLNVINANFHIVVNTRNAGTHTVFFDGSSAGTSTGASTTPDSDAAMHVFSSGSVLGTNSSGAHFNGRVAAYSVGAGLNTQQATDLRSALVTFFAAIGRT